jgi:L-threonylcarbamoyladenylate synthase
MPGSRRAKLYQPTPANIARLARALQRGDLVGVPTETVYGLAANAFDPKACKKIFLAKGRPANDPLIVHVHSIRQLSELAEPVPELSLLAEEFWPGPLTVVVPKKAPVPDIVTSGRASVAVRIPAHPVFRKLLRAAGLPLAAPSANPFGYISPTTAEHVMDSLGERIPHVLDGGPCKVGVESTILDLRDPRRPVILRPGAIEKRELERVLKRRVHFPKTSSTRSTVAAVAPGMLSKHYSPRTPLLLYPRLKADAVAHLHPSDAVLLFRKPTGQRGKDPRIHWLSERGSREEAARGLFAQLRALDQGIWRRIHCEMAPGSSALALAINDRLRRAAAKR